MSLEFEISEMKECIKIGEKAGKDMSYERSLVKSWKKYLQHGKPAQTPSTPTKSKSDTLNKE